MALAFFKDTILEKRLIADIDLLEYDPYHAVIALALYGTLGNTYGITKAQREQVEIAREEYAEVSETVNKLLGKELKSFWKKLDDTGIPWTPGRAIPKS